MVFAIKCAPTVNDTDLMYVAKSDDNSYQEVVGNFLQLNDEYEYYFQT